MATLEVSFLHNQLEERKRRLEAAIVAAPRNAGLGGLLREVDSALDRMAKGTYGLCEECHEPVEQDRLLADPLVRYCLDHLTQTERAALQRDLDLGLRGAAQPAAAKWPVRRRLGDQLSLRATGRGQRRLLRPDPDRWPALLCAGRRLRQRRGRVHADGAAACLVPQPDRPGPARSARLSPR